MADEKILYKFCVDRTDWTVKSDLNEVLKIGKLTLPELIDLIITHHYNNKVLRPAKVYLRPNDEDITIKVEFELEGYRLYKFYIELVENEEVDDFNDDNYEGLLFGHKIRTKHEPSWAVDYLNLEQGSSNVALMMAQFIRSSQVEDEVMLRNAMWLLKATKMMGLYYAVMMDLGYAVAW